MWKEKIDKKVSCCLEMRIKGDSGSLFHIICFGSCLPDRISISFFFSVTLSKPFQVLST